MKLILLASIMCSSFGVFIGANAADNNINSLPTVGVKDKARRQVDCTPPNDSPDCAALHAQIRTNFSPSEISMLFGSATASKQYPTSYSQTRKRYDKVLSDFQDGRNIAVIAVGDPIPVAKP